MSHWQRCRNTDRTDTVFPALNTSASCPPYSYIPPSPHLHILTKEKENSEFSEATNEKGIKVFGVPVPVTQARFLSFQILYVFPISVVETGKCSFRRIQCRIKWLISLSVPFLDVQEDISPLTIFLFFGLLAPGGNSLEWSFFFFS